MQPMGGHCTSTLRTDERTDGQITAAILRFAPRGITILTKHIDLEPVVKF